MSGETTESAVKVEVHEEPAWRRVIDVEIGVEAVDAAYAEVYKNLQKQAKIPGFRPGKAPLDMIRKRYGDRVEEDVLNILIPNTLTRVYREHNLIPITNPRLSNLHLKPGEPMRYRAAIEVRPEITPQGYDNLVLQKTATVEFMGQGGVFDFLRQFNLTLAQALEVSHHLPVWAAFSIYEGGQPGRVARRNAPTTVPPH